MWSDSPKPRWIYANFDSFEDASVQGNTVDFSGKQLPQAPRLTLSASAQYDFTLRSKFEGFARLEWAYRSQMTADLEGLLAVSGIPVDDGAGGTSLLPTFPYQIGAFNVVNLRLGLSWGPVLLIGYVENIGGQDYYTDTQDNFGLSGIRVHPHPREYGLKLSALF